MRTGKRSNATGFPRAMSIVLLAAGLLYAGLRFGTSDPGQACLARLGLGRAFVPQLATRLDVELAERLTRIGLVRADIKVRDATERGRRIREYTFACPQHLTPTLVHVEADRAASASHADEISAEERHEHGDELVIVLGFGRWPTHRLVVRSSTLPRDVAGLVIKPRLALVIDDLGNNMNDTARGFLELGVPITLAVLPDLGKSSEFFAAAQQRGIPTLLHLPMEPEGHEDPGKRAIHVGMSPEDVEALVDRHWKHYKTFFGVNNHMGSRATADRPVMEALVRALRRRDLVFVDSQTTPKSVGRSVSRQAGVWCIANDLFLDDGEETVEQVVIRLDRLAAMARRRGLAVGIAHPHPATLLALQQTLPRLQAHGIELVTVESLRPGASVASSVPGD